MPGSRVHTVDLAVFTSVYYPVSDETTWKRRWWYNDTLCNFVSTLCTNVFLPLFFSAVPPPPVRKIHERLHYAPPPSVKLHHVGVVLAKVTRFAFDTFLLITPTCRVLSCDSSLASRK